MPVVRNEGVDIAYDVSAPADAETVVFIQGWSYGRWMWQWQRAALDDYQTIVPDNRGSGRSEAPGLGMPRVLGKLPGSIRQPLIYVLHREKYSIERMAADVEGVLADAGVERAHLVGASMGGMIAQQYALDYDRAESLSLLCTTAGGDMENLFPEETTEHLENVPEGLDVRAEIKYLMEVATTEEWRERNRKLLDEIVDWRLDQDAPPAAREAQAMGQLGWDVREPIEHLDVPALVLHGDADRVVPIERGEEVANRLPDARFEVIEGGPHLVFVERAETVNEHLREFLADV